MRPRNESGWAIAVRNQRLSLRGPLHGKPLLLGDGRNENSLDTIKGQSLAKSRGFELGKKENRKLSEGVINGCFTEQLP